MPLSRAGAGGRPSQSESRAPGGGQGLGWGWGRPRDCSWKAPAVGQSLWLLQGPHRPGPALRARPRRLPLVALLCLGPSVYSPGRYVHAGGGGGPLGCCGQEAGIRGLEDSSGSASGLPGYWLQLRAQSRMPAQVTMNTHTHTHTDRKQTDRDMKTCRQMETHGQSHSQTL